MDGGCLPAADVIAAAAQNQFQGPQEHAMKVFLSLQLLLVMPLGGWCQLSSPSPDQALTLEQAIALALRENRVVREAENEAAKAGYVLAATRTSRLPSMEVFSLAGEQFVEPLQAANPLATIVPGVGSFFSLGLQRRPTNIFA